MAAPDPVTTVHLRVRVNDRDDELTVAARTLLVHLLRDELGLTGTHIGCDTSSCGACTVLLDGLAVKSCTVLAAQADGCEVRTVESLAGPGGTLSPIQEGFRQCHGLQCGYCTPGMLMAATGLLADDADPSPAAIREALEGNLCRCTGYASIVASIRWAAEHPDGIGAP